MPRKTFQAAHVELRYKTYYAVLYIPKDVRAIIGKTKFSKSTKTGDRNKAERIAAAFTISWNAEIERARLNYENPLIAEAESLLENLRHSSSRHSVVEIIQERTREILEETGEPLISNEFNAIASGKRKSLASIIPEWKIAQTEKGLKQKTIDQMSKDVGLLVKTFTTAELLTAKYVICQGRCHGLQTAVSVSFGLSGAGLSQTTPGLDQSLVGPRQRSGRAALAC